MIAAEAAVAVDTGMTVEAMTVVMTGVVMTETGMIVTMIEEEMTGITTVGTTGTMTEGMNVMSTVEMSGNLIAEMIDEALTVKTARAVKNGIKTAVLRRRKG